MTDAYLKVNSRDLKMMREALCVAESHLLHSNQYSGHGKLIGPLIREIDKHRPLGPDYKHGKRHTQTCGCEDGERP